MKRALVTLTVSESKRLIARSVVSLPEIQKAREKGYIIVAGGTTNGYVVEELIGEKIAKEKYTAGIICGGRACITPEETRIAPVVLKDGKMVTEDWTEAVNRFGRDDVFIKGASAIDFDGVAGVLMASPAGGTIGKALPIVSARGSHLIIPVGLEKLIPSVPEAANLMGIDVLEQGIGKKVGLMCVDYGELITEIEALEILAGVDVIPAAAGGVGGTEGGQTLILIGDDEELEDALEIVKGIKGEPPLLDNKAACPCSSPCMQPLEG